MEDFWREEGFTITKDSIIRDALVKSFYEGKWMAPVFETDHKGRLVPSYTHCVYVIYNDIDDKIYFGSSLQKADKRFERHVEDAKKGSNSQLYNHMRQIGIEHFHPVAVKIIWLPKIKNQFSSFWRCINIAVLENFESQIIKEYWPTGRLLNERTPGQNQSVPPPSMRHLFVAAAPVHKSPSNRPSSDTTAIKLGIQTAIVMLGDREPAVRSILQALIEHTSV